MIKTIADVIKTIAGVALMDIGILAGETLPLAVGDSFSTGDQTFVVTGTLLLGAKDEFLHWRVYAKDVTPWEYEVLD